MRYVRRIARLIGRTLIVTGCTGVVLVVLPHLCFRPNPQAASQEQYAVYSAYIDDGLTGDSHSFGDPTGLVVIFANSTMIAQPQSILRKVWSTWFSVERLSRREPPIRLPLLYRFFWSNLPSRKFERRFDIRARYTFIESAAEYFDPKFQQRYADSYGFLSLSSVAFARDMSEALFYAEHICGL